MSAKRPILILQMQRMGDLILSYPLLLWLARQYPGHPLFVAAEEIFYKPLMRISPKATYVPWTGVNILRQQHFELVINLSIREEAARLAHDLRAEARLGPTQTPDGVRFVHGPWQLYRTSLVGNNRFNRFHWADLNAMDAIPAKAMATTRFDPPRTLPPDTGRVGLFLGASEPGKRPSAAFWADLVRELLGRGLRPVLFGGPAEKDLGRQVMALSKAPALNLCGTLGLDEFGAVGQSLALLVTPDTGPMHLAAWTGLKCLNLSMGHVNPWETGPYPPGHLVLRADMDCAHGCWQCTRDRLHCHAPFAPARIAVLAARVAAGDKPDKLARLTLPGLTLSSTARRHGLFALHRLDPDAPDAQRLVSRFWQAFFLWRLGGRAEPAALAAWNELAGSAPEAANALLTHIPEMGRQLKHGLRTGALLSDTFWTCSPAVARPLAGYVQMALANGCHSRTAWAEALELLEALISVSG
ncbi:glycosyltransferase family 9 protein [Pseudodesulfovibrio sp. F-1]|uniref:Glycosyltransferase family 9 protein n=1 Tax=Pseudodesulfovibrio alkaliphilus TaxID=2661613 RepID=A0A7K1KKX7_9BACT|nr:glycosyltransferase family 9 protein [Pseudodesulfovibrio alkaliphilus]MUM76690.1 glycosyltransferase family 9 protein [Pseudodesulfovibrio alkaliphilus]